VKFPQAAYKRLETVVKENNEMNQNVNLFKGRKKLKFMDDSQDIDYVSVPLSVERKLHPLTDHQREVAATNYMTRRAQILCHWQPP